MLYLTDNQIEQVINKHLQMSETKFKSFLLADLEHIFDINEFTESLIKHMQDSSVISNIENPLYTGLYGVNVDNKKELVFIDGTVVTQEQMNMPTPKKLKIHIPSIKFDNNIFMIYIECSSEYHNTKTNVIIDINNKNAFVQLVNWYLEQVRINVSITYTQFNLDYLNEELEEISKDFNLYGITNIPQFKVVYTPTKSVNSITYDKIVFNVLLDDALHYGCWLSNFYDYTNQTLKPEIFQSIGSMQNTLQWFVNIPKWLHLLVTQKIPTSINRALKQIYTRNFDNVTKKENIYYVTKNIDNSAYGALIKSSEKETTLLMPIFTLDNGMFTEDISIERIFGE